jgi:hypothetical protein
MAAQSIAGVFLMFPDGSDLNRREPGRGPRGLYFFAAQDLGRQLPITKKLSGDPYRAPYCAG